MHVVLHMCTHIHTDRSFTDMHTQRHGHIHVHTYAWTYKNRGVQTLAIVNGTILIIAK